MASVYDAALPPFRGMPPLLFHFRYTLLSSAAAPPLRHHYIAEGGAPPLRRLRFSCYATPRRRRRTIYLLFIFDAAQQRATCGARSARRGAAKIRHSHAVACRKTSSRVSGARHEICAISSRFAARQDVVVVVFDIDTLRAYHLIHSRCRKSGFKI